MCETSDVPSGWGAVCVRLVMCLVGGCSVCETSDVPSGWVQCV